MHSGSGVIPRYGSPFDGLNVSDRLSSSKVWKYRVMIHDNVSRIFRVGLARRNIDRVARTNCLELVLKGRYYAPHRGLLKRSAAPLARDSLPVTLIQRAYS